MADDRYMTGKSILQHTIIGKLGGSRPNLSACALAVDLTEGYP